jgi:hypothetical protein
MSFTTTNKQDLLALGMKEEELGNYNSDLHVLTNKISTAWMMNYTFRMNVTKFKSSIDGKIWYEVPFGYQEYHLGRR